MRNNQRKYKVETDHIKAKEYKKEGLYMRDKFNRFMQGAME